MMGDRRMDVIGAVAYLDPLISPTASDADRSVAEEWLTEHGLADVYEPMRRWIAAFWSAAVDDARLQEWCRSVLLD